MMHNTSAIILIKNLLPVAQIIASHNILFRVKTPSDYIPAIYSV